MDRCEFRGKRSHDEKWVSGNLIYSNNGKTYIYPFEVIEEDGHHLQFNTGEAWWVKSETIGEFTGLLDRNGKRIFEGDIVSLFDKYNGKPAEGYGKIIFSYGYVGGWVVTSNGEDRLSLNAHIDIVEVIGNIHDNRELLTNE